VIHGASAAPSRASGRDLGLLLLSGAGMAFCITLLFLGMRSVMDVGGACADGGPYVSANPCPEGSALAMFVGIFGLFGFGALGFWAGASVGGPWLGLPLLAWPALFLSLGFNFLQYGIAPPWGGGLEWGFLVPGIIFMLMGGVPLVIAWRLRRDFEGDDAGDRIAATFGLPTTGGRSVRLSYGHHPARSAATASFAAAAPVMPASGGHPIDVPGGSDELVDRLERLAHLRRSGDLTNDEFETAKAALLDAAAREGGRS